MFNLKIKAKNFDNNILSDIYEKTYGLFSDICIMPDTHKGTSLPIGFVGKLINIKDGIDPRWIGNDIGCGMMMMRIKKSSCPDMKDKDWKKIYDKFHNMLLNGNCNTGEWSDWDIQMPMSKEKMEFYSSQVGTIGGGNHFLEVSEGKDYYYIIVHSGSRKFGADICKYWTGRIGYYDKNKIKDLIQDVPKQDRAKFIEEYKNKNKNSNYLVGEDVYKYLYDMEEALFYACVNRETILKNFCKIAEIPIDFLEIYNMPHNYIDIDSGIVHKGSISATNESMVVIPINMRDGSIIGVGKGNEDWMSSAPHGAGRILSRSEAKELISIEEFEESMKGVNTFSVVDSTRDEAPMAYRDIEEILETIGETIDIIDIAKPIFNYKGV